MIRHGAYACCILLLCGCPTVDLGDQPPDPGLCTPAGGYAYFQSDIATNYLKLADRTNGCGRNSMCHEVHAPAFDLNDPGSATNYRAAQNYLLCGAYLQSPLLTKPLTGQDGHGGGDLFDTNSPQYMTFVGWFK
jgi:hypothetical protein